MESHSPLVHLAIKHGLNYTVHVNFSDHRFEFKSLRCILLHIIRSSFLILCWTNNLFVKLQYRNLNLSKQLLFLIKKPPPFGFSVEPSFENGRIVEDGRDNWTSLVQPCAQTWGSYNSLLRDVSVEVFYMEYMGTSWPLRTNYSNIWLISVSYVQIKFHGF